jgi:hypothetical protein
VCVCVNEIPKYVREIDGLACIKIQWLGTVRGLRIVKIRARLTISNGRILVSNWLLCGSSFWSEDQE